MLNAIIKECFVAKSVEDLTLNLEIMSSSVCKVVYSFVPLYCKKLFVKVIPKRNLFYEVLHWQHKFLGGF